MNKELFDQLLNHYNISYDDYLALTQNKTLENFDAGKEFDHILEAAELTKKVISEKGKIAIFGDYDADGIMGTSILVKMFQLVNYPVSYYLPNRYQDGYGINMNKAKEYVENGYSLIITVDNGVTAFEPIAFLKEKGLEVIVLDHHTPEDKLPNADYVIHPFISNYSKTTSSGAFVAFKFSQAFLGYSDKYLSTLAAISLISDMMPIVDQNRFLLRTVFKNYIKGEYLPFNLLGENSMLDENVIGMKIAPRINSIGRLIDDSSINEIVKFFVSDDKEFILNYFEKIKEINENRKTLTKEGSDIVDINENDPSIVFACDAKSGIIGLIATSLVGKYKKPVIVFSKEGNDGILKGSARSIEGFNIVDAFRQLDTYLEAYGGHAYAGGCSIKEEKLEEFKAKFNELVANSTLVIKDRNPITININDINIDNCMLIQTFSPFGEEWRAPELLLKGVKVSSLAYSKNLLHINKFIGYNQKLVGWNLSKEFMSQFNFVNMYGYLATSEYLGKVSAEFSIRKIEEPN